MGKKIRVENYPGLVMDAESGAILNINTKEIEAAKKRKAHRKQQLENQENLRTEVSELKSEMNAIKELLTKLVEKQ